MMFLGPSSPPIPQSFVFGVDGTQSHLQQMSASCGRKVESQDGSRGSDRQRFETDEAQTVQCRKRGTGFRPNSKLRSRPGLAVGDQRGPATGANAGEKSCVFRIRFRPEAIGGRCGRWKFGRPTHGCVTRPNFTLAFSSAATTSRGEAAPCTSLTAASAAATTAARAAAVAGSPSRYRARSRCATNVT